MYSKTITLVYKFKKQVSKNDINNDLIQKFFFQQTKSVTDIDSCCRSWLQHSPILRISLPHTKLQIN